MMSNGSAQGIDQGNLAFLPAEERIRAAMALGRPDGSTSVQEALRMLRRAAADGDLIAAELVDRVDVWMIDRPRLGEPERVCDEPYIAFWQGFLSAFECAYVITAARRALRPSDVIDSQTGKQVKSDVRVSETAWWQPSQMDPVLYSVFEKTVTAFGGDVALAEPMSVVRYRPGGKFLVHVDAYKNYSTGELDETARATTSVVYLN